MQSNSIGNSILHLQVTRNIKFTSDDAKAVTGGMVVNYVLELVCRETALYPCVNECKDTKEH